MADTVSRVRRAREREGHRRSMLQAAEAVFAEKGFEYATMEEVARRAEFSVGALYNFFPSKDALFGEVLRCIATDFYAAFRAELKQRRPILETIRSVLRLHVAEIIKHGPFFRTVVAMNPVGAVCPDSVIPRECRDIYDRYVSDMARLLGKAMSQGVIRKQDPVYTALALEGVVHACAAYWTRKNMSPSLEERMARIERNFLDAILVTKRGK